MARTRIVSLLALGMLAACRREYVGPNGEKVTVDQSGKNVTVASSGGTATYSGGAGAALPADFPKDIPVYPGATVTASYAGANAAGAGRAVTFETGDSPEKVVDFYKSKLAGWASAGEVRSAGSTTVVLRAPTGARTVSVMAAPNGAGKTSVTLTIAG